MDKCLLTYEEFIKIVPSETKTFVDGLLTSVNFNISNTLTIDSYKFDSKYDKEYILYLAIASYMYDNYESTKLLLNKYNFNNILSKHIYKKEKNNDIDVSSIFSEFSNFFCIFDDITDYYKMIPDDILKNSLLKIELSGGDSSPRYTSSLFDDIFKNVFPYFRHFRNDYSDYIGNLKKRKNEELEIEFFRDLPIETINYLKKVARIHEVMERYSSNNDDLVSFSLLVALYYCDDANYIVSYLSNLGLTKDGINQTLQKFNSNYSVNFSLSNNNNIKIEYLIHYYKKFLVKSLEEGYITKQYEVCIHDIVKNASNRNLSNSLIFESVMNDANIQSDIFKNINAELVEYQKNYEKIKEKQLLKDVYNKLPLSSSKYIEFVSKIYSSIYANNGKNSSKVLYDNDSIIDISVFVSVFYKLPTLATYFIENNITLKKCLDYLNIKDVDFNTLELNNESIKLLYQKLIEQAGLANNEKINNEMIFYNVMKRKNPFVIKLLCDISNKDIFTNRFDFEKEIGEHVKLQQRNNNIAKAKKFYGELKIENIRYIELSYIVYKKIRNNNYFKNFSTDDLISLSLLLVVFKYDNCNSEFLRSLFNNLNQLYDTTVDIRYFSFNANIFDENIDIDFIIKNYGKYIFGGFSKNKDKKDITQYDIIKNVIENVNNSVILNDFLDKYKESIKNIDMLYIKFLKENRNLNFEVIDRVEKINRAISKTPFNNIVEQTTISILIYLYYYNNNLVKYLERRNIKLEDILNYIGVTKEELEQFKTFDTNISNIITILDITPILNYGTIENDIENIVENGNISLSTLNAFLEYMKVDAKEIKYELKNDKYYEEYIKQKKIKKIRDIDVDFNIVDKIDKIYRTIKNNEFSKEYNIGISTLIYIYYSDNNIVKYFKNSDIEIDDILDYFNIEKEELEQFETLDTDFDSIMDNFNTPCFKYYNIGGIMDSIFDDKRSFKEPIENITCAKGVNYDHLKSEIREDKYYEQLMEEAKVTVNEKGDFNLVNDLIKIYRVISYSKKIGGVYTGYTAASFIYLYYYDNNLVKYLKNMGITLDDILDYIGISKKELDKFKNLDIDYNKIIDSYYNIDIIKFKNIEDVIGFIVTKYWHLIVNYKNIDLEKLKYELQNGEEYVPPLTREEKLELYIKEPIPELKINSIDEISNYGNDLAEQSTIITKEYIDFVQGNESDSYDVVELQKSIKGISKPSVPKRRGLFSRKEKVEQSENNLSKTEIIDRLDKFLENKEQSLSDGLKELQYIRLSIGVYLEKANSYLNTLNKSKEMLDEEIRTKNYLENDYRIYDDNLRKQILDDKIAGISSSILKMMQQYQRITMQMSTHAALKNQVNIARNTVIQNLSIELALHEEIAKEKDSINALKSLMNLLDNVSVVNQGKMLENIEDINLLSNGNRNIGIEGKDKLLLEQILDEENKPKKIK